jgi:hypothetical protein
MAPLRALKGKALRVNARGGDDFTASGSRSWTNKAAVARAGP